MVPNIEDQEWYHGFRARMDAMRLIGYTPGNFMVRATDTCPDAEIVISVCDDDKRAVNIAIKFDGGWHLATKNPNVPSRNKFPSIVALIEHYMAHGITRTVHLTNVIARPIWQQRNENVMYETKDRLGTGHFFNAYKGLLSKAGAEPQDVVIKISQVTAADAEPEKAKHQEARKEMIQEAQIMSYYMHNNIVQFMGVACDNQPVLVLMEFCAGGDLLSHLHKFGKETEEQEKLVYLYEAAMGMSYLHCKKSVHGNLAARNCLISNNGRVKIADFGLSKMMDAGQSEGATNSSNVLPLVRWRAPETLYRPGNFTNHSDVWTFGVVAYEVFSNGGMLWPDYPVKHVASLIKKGKMPSMPAGTPLIEGVHREFFLEYENEWFEECS